MAITNLTNTKWNLNNTITYVNNFSYEIEWRYNDHVSSCYGYKLSMWEEQNYLYCFGDKDTDGLIGYNTLTEIPINTNSKLEPFTIIGGADVTNPDLITWLQENATQVIEELPSSKETYFSIMSELAQTIAEKTGIELPLTIEEMIEALGETSSVNITLDCAFGGYSNNSTVRVKFGSAPTDNSDSDYYYKDGAFMVSRYNFDGAPGSITVQSKAYIWYTTVTGQEDNLVGYKLNNGSLITPGYGYSNATKIELKEGDILTLISTMLD